MNTTTHASHILQLDPDVPRQVLETTATHTDWTLVRDRPSGEGYDSVLAWSREGAREANELLVYMEVAPLMARFFILPQQHTDTWRNALLDHSILRLTSYDTFLAQASEPEERDVSYWLTRTSFHLFEHGVHEDDAHSSRFFRQLCALLEDEHGTLRYGAIIAIETLGWTEFVEPLEQCLQQAQGDWKEVLQDTLASLHRSQT